MSTCASLTVSLFVSVQLLVLFDYVCCIQRVGITLLLTLNLLHPSCKMHLKVLKFGKITARVCVDRYLRELHNQKKESKKGIIVDIVCRQNMINLFFFHIQLFPVISQNIGFLC